MAERGTCRACGRQMNLKKDGTLRHHSGEPWVLGRPSYCCRGTDQLPEEATDDRS